MVYARGMNTKKNIAVVPNAVAVKAVFDPQEPTKNLTITSGLLGVDEEGNYSMLGSIKPAKASVLTDYIWMELDRPKKAKIEPCEVIIAVKSSGVDKTYGKLSESMAELGEITNLAVAREKFVGSKNYVLPLHEKTFKDFDEAPPIKETFVVSVTQ